MFNISQVIDANSIKLETVDLQFATEQLNWPQTRNRTEQQQDRICNWQISKEQLDTSSEGTELMSEFDMELDRRKAPSLQRLGKRNTQNTLERDTKLPDVFRYFGNIERIKEPSAKPGAISATCNACQTRIKGFLTVTSNFIKHLRVRHSKIHAAFVGSKYGPETPEEQQNDSFEQRVMCYIIDNALPLTTVETLSFRNLFKNTNLRVMSHAKLKSRLDERFEQMLGNIKKLLASQKYVCITTDICSNSSECKYFGYSCHWLDKKYQRHSVALACRRFSGDHAQILEMISKINDDYEFNNLKIVGAITNNDTNCTIAFQEFGIDLRRDTIVEDESSYEAHKELRELICDALPNRIQCTGEILNLLASTDFLELLSKDKNLKERHLKIMAKCSALWRKCFCTQSAQIVATVLDDALVCPSRNRWFSIYDSICCLLLHKDRLAELCSRLALHNSCFSVSDLQYLDEYRILMSPIATTIEFLRMESNLYYGCLIPALTSLCVKLKRVSDALELSDLKTLAFELQLKLKQRFSDYILLAEDANSAIIASVLCPGIKMRWFNVLAKVSALEQRSAKEIHQIVIAEAVRHAKATENVCQSAMEAAYITRKDDFYEFDEMDDVCETSDLDMSQPSPLPAATKLLEDAEAQLLSYLKDPGTTFEALEKYPLLQDLARKYNTPLTSTLEGGLSDLYTNRYNPITDLADYSVEKLILLKANYNF
ncbi:uncharacterized protein LOC111596262 [Drosophila hydei]|uniref:Uncharacterized protein LOC111596262 n=1 Tax=Drosophila hydei TaxID=7224 RepID=A0A6J1LR49_DROHY|nr:uncharacterized protein LOC111596262 [Drosophila hydei]XP_030080503.1 uncharacterized protein LOC111596262 [Drosophila hydei]XP_030080504.1 uncharacterized protein LOC111596262 [Drosophila hydei]